MASVRRCAGMLLVGIAVCVLVVVWGVPGCRKGAEKKSDGASAQSTKPDRVYVIRGVVVEVPDPKRPTTEFVVKHEAIDDFVADSSGKVVGMGTMEMPFPPAKGVSLEGIAVGDIVQLEFGVWYAPTRRWNAMSVKKLPPDTKLEFREARPQAKAPQ